MGTHPESDAGRANETPGYEEHRQQTAPTVICPRGHVNTWDYKFCGECGSPIGLVPWPADDSAPRTAAPTKSRVPLVVGAAALLVVVGVAAAAVFVVIQPSDRNRERPGSQPGTASARVSPGATTCPVAPQLEAESIDLTSDGLEVRAAFMSSCGGEDIESNSALEVSVAKEQRDVAAGRFDFSSAPLRMKPGVPTRRTLVFPPGMYWRTPDMLSGAPELKANRAGSSESSSVNAGSEPTTMVAAASAKPAHGSVEGVADAVLKELRESDFPTVRNSLSNTWVPQVSSKRVGLVAEGKTWTSADILRDHLTLRQRFRGARLVWSGQWTTFNAPDFWVTVVGRWFESADGANQWCDSNGFGINDCFAKFISTLFGVEGTTVYRK